MRQAENPWERSEHARNQYQLHLYWRIVKSKCPGVPILALVSQSFFCCCCRITTAPPRLPPQFILNVITPANTASNWPLTLTGTVYEKNGTHISLITEQRDKNSPETAFCRLIGSDAISWKPSSGTAFLCCWKITLTQVAEPIPNDFRSITVMIILGEITSKIEPISISMKRLFIVFKMSRVCTTFCS